jgi:hypothetical protein
MCNVVFVNTRVISYINLRKRLNIPMLFKTIQSKEYKYLLLSKIKIFLIEKITHNIN